MMVSSQSNHLMRIVLSGCSGAGKSTLLEELCRRGHKTVSEPGRRIVQDQLATNGTDLPWINMAGFLARCTELAIEDFISVENHEGYVFFDRSLIDAVAAFERFDIPTPTHLNSSLDDYRYHSHVFLFPPWEELFENDSERRHSFQVAVDEYDDLRETFPATGYKVITVPMVSVVERADFIVAHAQQPDRHVHQTTTFYLLLFVNKRIFPAGQFG